MCAVHRKNMGVTIDQIRGQRLAAQIADIYAIAFADLNCVKARRLAADGMDPGRGYLNIFTVTYKPAEQSFCDRTAANVTSADKENAFHDSNAAPADAQQNVVLNESKVNQASRLRMA